MENAKKLLLTYWREMQAADLSRDLTARQRITEKYATKLVELNVEAKEIT